MLATATPPATAATTTTTTTTISSCYSQQNKTALNFRSPSPWHWRWNKSPFSAGYCHPLHLSVPENIQWQKVSKRTFESHIHPGYVYSGQISTIPKPEFFGHFGDRIPLPSPPFGVGPRRFGRSFFFPESIYLPIPSMYGIFTYIYHILPLKTTKCR